MGTYIDESDVDAVFAEANVDRWADQDGDKAADPGRIDLGITAGEGYFEARMRGGPYALPVACNDARSTQVVKDICAKFAAEHIYKARGLTDEDDEGKDKIIRLADEARRTVALLLAGSSRLDATLSHDGPTAPVPV